MDETTKTEYRKEWQRKKRENYRTAKSDPELNRQRNMYFLKCILENLNLNCHKLSKMVGMTQQSIQWWFTVDDGSLKKIKDTLAKIDICLECSYEGETKERPADNENYTLSIDRDLQLNIRRKKDVKDTLWRTIENEGNMAFLARFILKQYGDIRTFADSMGIAKPTVYSWFYRDDIKISDINAIGRKSSHKVNWSVTAIKS